MRRGNASLLCAVLCYHIGILTSGSGSLALGTSLAPAPQIEEIVGQKVPQAPLDPQTPLAPSGDRALEHASRVSCANPSLESLDCEHAAMAMWLRIPQWSLVGVVWKMLGPLHPDKVDTVSTQEQASKWTSSRESIQGLHPLLREGGSASGTLAEEHPTSAHSSPYAGNTSNWRESARRCEDQGGRIASIPSVARAFGSTELLQRATACRVKTSARPAHIGRCGPAPSADACSSAQRETSQGGLSESQNSSPAVRWAMGKLLEDSEGQFPYSAQLLPDQKKGSGGAGVPEETEAARSSARNSEGQSDCRTGRARSGIRATPRSWCHALGCRRRHADRGRWTWYRRGRGNEARSSKRSTCAFPEYWRPSTTQGAENRGQRLSNCYERGPVAPFQESAAFGSLLSTMTSACIGQHTSCDLISGANLSRIR